MNGNGYRTRSKGSQSTIETNPVLFEYTGSACDQASTGKEVITFTKHDSRHLQSPNYLNDTVMSFFMQYHLDNFVDDEIKQKVHIFSSFFFAKIKSIYSKPSTGSDKNVKCASRWLKGVKIFDKDFLFLPVCEENHWLLVVVCYPARQPDPKYNLTTDDQLYEPAVFILNSMQGPAPGVKKVLCRFLSSQWLIERKSERKFPINNAKANGIRLFFPEVPLQRNNYNCGVYVLNYFKCFLKSPRETYIKMFRNCKLNSWFEDNHIKITMERTKMLDIVRKQNKLWATPENVARRADMDNELGRNKESQNTVIEIN